ncbi:MAG: hypothetical protein AB7N91_01600 [Candidatus Tectimicrobiota bacterium]
MGLKRSGALSAYVMLISLLTGCTLQAPYMRGWDLAEGIDNRWTKGTFDMARLSPDEQTVYQELGTPEAVRFFRTLETRQKAYEWIYLQREQTVWFVAGKRVDYVAVDADTSFLTKEERETLQDKLTAGGIVGAVVGGVAAGSLLLGERLGLR